jgi:hypothetical protein
MNRYFSTGLTVLFFILDIICLKSQSKDPFIDSINEKLSIYCQTVPFEDIFIHSDRNTYISGEYLWFSAYLLDRQSLSLTSGSSYAYIELLDPANRPVSQIRVRLEEGTGGGGFRLPDSLSSGEYTLRAYTNWMKNFLPHGCFMKTLTIYNPLREFTFKKKSLIYFPDNCDYNIAFFPEGGMLLSGFVNKVGIIVNYKRNREKGYKSYLLDEKNDTITLVVVDSTGIGSFEFYAGQGENYKLISDNTKDTFALPLISQTGFSLNVKNRINDSLKIIVNTNRVTSAGSEYFYVVIQSRGNNLYGSRVNISGKSTVISIVGNKLTQGINQISIFDSQGNPVCSRYIFIPVQPSDNNIIMNTADRAGKREKFSLEIGLDTNLISNLDLSNFSLSVSAVNGTEKNSGISDYLITGNEFRPIDGDGFICSEVFRMSFETIDNYLLSIKSNWIIWEDLIQNKVPEIKFLAEKEKQFLSGFYISTDKTETNHDQTLLLSIPGKVPVFKYAKTDQKNRFVFAIRDNESSYDYIIQPSEKNDNYLIQIESPFSDNYPESEGFIDTTRKGFPDEIVKWSINYQVEKIYGISNIGDTIRTIISHSKPIRFYGKPDKELILSDYISLPVMEEVFFELLPGVKVKSTKSKSEVLMQYPVNRNYSDDLPALLVDGVIIDDPSIILKLDPELVEKIDIVKGEYVVGDLVFYGIISVITKSGDFRSVSLPANAIRIDDYGYNFVRKFKSPDYSSGFNKADRFPDFRNTIYWNHNLKPDKYGIINVDIMTSDFVTAYEINFQGVAGSKVISVRKTIRVE